MNGFLPGLCRLVLEGCACDLAMLILIIIVAALVSGFSGLAGLLRQWLR